MDGIVALNHATGLRFLHYEDVAVGVWVSGMRLKFITDWDIGYRFVGQANLWGPDQLDVLKVRPPELYVIYLLDNGMRHMYARSPVRIIRC